MSARQLAERFDLGDDAILRHSANHLPPQARAAILAAQHPSEIDLAALKTSESEGLLAGLVMQRARLHSIGEMALMQEDTKVAISAESAITANLSLTAKLLGQLVSVHDHRHSSLLLSPDYLRLREVLVTTLRAFPEAGRAVAAALHQLESAAALDIQARAVKPPKPAQLAPVLIEHEPEPLPPPPPSRESGTFCPPLPPPPPPPLPPPPWPGRPC
jgi:hypothetical protein